MATKRQVRKFDSWVARELYLRCRFGAAESAIVKLDLLAETEDGKKRSPTMDEVERVCAEANQEHLCV